MATPNPNDPREAEKDFDALPSGHEAALKISEEAEHETGLRREKLTRKATDAAANEKTTAPPE